MYIKERSFPHFRAPSLPAIHHVHHLEIQFPPLSAPSIETIEIKVPFSSRIIFISQIVEIHTFTI